MKDILKALEKSQKLELKSYQSKSLFEYIEKLKEEAKDAQVYKEELKKSVIKAMGIHNLSVSVDTLKSIVQKLSVSELIELRDGYEQKQAFLSPMSVQLQCKNCDEEHNDNKCQNKEFTI